MKKTKRRRGRPRKWDAGNFQRTYVVFRTDTCAYIKNAAAERRLSFSAMAQELVEVGIAAQRERRTRPIDV
jgi:hypothetical protein